MKEFQARRIRATPPLPLLDGSRRTEFKQPIHVGKRMVVLYALTGLAHDADPKKLAQWLSDNGVSEELLPSERSLLTKQPLSQQDEIDLSWKQESLYTLAWSAGLVEDLGWPTAECNLDELFPRIPPEIEIDQFVHGITLREEEEILHQTDRHYCLHWILRHPEVWAEREAVEKLMADVILERRTALEWLIGSAETWDDVSLDT